MGARIVLLALVGCGLERPGLGDEALQDAAGVDARIDTDAAPVDAARVDAARDGAVDGIDAGRDGGAEILDAEPSDVGPPDIDAGPPDTGPPDTGPSDTGPSDTGPPDTGPPDTGPPPACATTFGGVGAYHECTQTATTCEFYTNPPGDRSCDAVCGDVGRTCIDAWRELGLCGHNEDRTCDFPMDDMICLCTR